MSFKVEYNEKDEAVSVSDGRGSTAAFEQREGGAEKLSIVMRDEGGQIRAAAVIDLDAIDALLAARRLENLRKLTKNV